MDKNKIKRDVLQSLIDEMDNHMVDGLKSKSPKFQKVEVLAEKPEELAEGLDKAKEMLAEPEEEEEQEESEGFTSDMSDEDKEKLIELYKKLKG